MVTVKIFTSLHPAFVNRKQVATLKRVSPDELPASSSFVLLHIFRIAIVFRVHM